MMFTAQDTYNQYIKPISQRKKDVWLHLVKESQKRKEFINQTPEYLKRRKVFEKQLKGGYMDIEVEAGSVDELLLVIGAVSDELGKANQKVRQIKLGLKGQRKLVLFTRDWSKAYYQFGNANANQNWFTYFRVDKKLVFDQKLIAPMDDGENMNQCEEEGWRCGHEEAHHKTSSFVMEKLMINKATNKEIWRAFLDKWCQGETPLVSEVTWFHKDMSNEDEKLLIFGENQASRNNNSNKPSWRTQAVLRGRRDAFGIITCKDFGRPFDQKDFGAFQQVVQEDITLLQQKFQDGKYKSFGLPTESFGLGEARMPKRFYRLLISSLEDLFNKEQAGRKEVRVTSNSRISNSGNIGDFCDNIGGSGSSEVGSSCTKDCQGGAEKGQSGGGTHFGGEWIYGKSFTLNMGALPAIIGFLRISECIMHALWFLGVPCIIYIDDLICICYAEREVATACLVDTLNVQLGLENSAKAEARQSTSGARGFAKVLGIIWRQFNNGFLLTMPETKVEKTYELLEDIQWDCDRNRLDLDSVRKAMGLASHAEDSKPSELGRALFQDVYSWTSEEFFNKHKKNQTERRKLWASLEMVKKIVKLGTPNVLDNHLTDREEIIIFADAAGQETDGACAAAIAFGIQEQPVVDQAEILRDNTDFEIQEDFDKRAKDIKFWEMVALINLVKKIGKDLRGKYVRIFVDNSNELFALVAPASAKTPMMRYMAIRLHLTFMGLGVTPYFSFIASERNLADIWTRLKTMSEAQSKLEGHIKRLPAEKMQIKQYLKFSSKDILGRIEESHNRYCKKHHTLKVKRI